MNERRPGTFWRRLLWAHVWPRPRERIAPTISGTILIGLCLGLGTAAYNSSSNILFIALSLLLACLVLSGVLSWLNLRSIRWELSVAPTLRAGEESEVFLEVANPRGFLPTYALWFEFSAQVVEPGPPAKPESTLTGRGIDFRAILKRGPGNTQSGTVHLSGRLDPRSSTRLVWRFTPPCRGTARVELTGVGSLFPFGFLRKVRSTKVRREVCVWPAAIPYRRNALPAPRRPSGEVATSRPGSGGDLRSLRPYDSGDSHRLIHWKASARSGRLMVRQFSAESSESYSLWLRTSEELWPKKEPFELQVALAASLAEDLFRRGSLEAVVVDAEPPVLVRRLADLEAFLDRMAVVHPSASPANLGEPRLPGLVLALQPDGPRGAAAVSQGIHAATA